MVFGSSLSSHGFIVDENDEILCFGKNCDYQLGLGHKKRIEDLIILQYFKKKRVCKICCGWKHTIFLVENKLYASGSNYYGQLCLDAVKLNFNYVKIPTPFSIIIEGKQTEIIDIFVGLQHTILLSKFFDVYGAGRNADGQLGNLSTNNTIYNGTHLQVEGVVTKCRIPEKVISVSCGAYYTFFISFSGNIFVCGDNNHGQLGIGSFKGTSTAIAKVLSFSPKRVIQISCGGEHTFFLTSDHEVFCTGFNSAGRLGIGNTLNKCTPTRMHSFEGEKIELIKCGGYHSFFVGKSKMFKCGFNAQGQLGTGDLKDVISPVLFSIEGKKVVQSLMMDASSIHFTKNEVFGSGSNENGELFSSRKKNFIHKQVVIKLCNLKVKKFKEEPKEVRKRFEFLLESKAIEIIII